MSDDLACTSSFQRMQYFLREIGQGPKGARDLTIEEAKEALGLILDELVTPAQAGGFLLVQRFKGESPDELQGFADSIRERSNLIRPKVTGLLDIGSPYDGRVRSLSISSAASIVTTATGVPVVMHGEKGIGPKHGVTVGEVLSELGIEVDAAPKEVQSSIEEDGFGYMKQSLFTPTLFSLRNMREEISLRSNLNTVEKLYNLASASYSIIGLTHLPYLEKMLEATTRMGFKRLMIIQGIEGNEDAPTSRPCRVFESADGKIDEYRLNPGDYDIAPATSEDIAGGDATYNAKVILSLLQGEATKSLTDLVAFNAGIRIYLAGRAASVQEGLTQAQEALSSGSALAKLKTLQRRTATRAT